MAREAMAGVVSHLASVGAKLSLLSGPGATIGADVNRDPRIIGVGLAKQTFIGYPTNASLESFVFAEFFRKTGKTTFASSA